MENANTQNSKCDILSNFHTLCMKGGAYYIIILAPGYVCRCNALMSLLTSNWMSRMHLQLTPNPVNNDAYRQTNSIYRHSKIPPFISIKCCHNNIPKIFIVGGILKSRGICNRGTILHLIESLFTFRLFLF